MMLLELAQMAGLCPKKTSSTNGGEFHSQCPECGGTDRFAIWPIRERYWCRRCRKHGDAIQFCRDFLGMSFQDAQAQVGNTITKRPITRKHDIVLSPPSSWEEKANKFVENSRHRLLIDSVAMECVKKRGLSHHSISEYKLGWNPIHLFPNRDNWGLEKRIENGKEKKLWVPSGIVIPMFLEQSLRKIKIRRNDWVEGDRFGKYYIIPGSIDLIPIFGIASQPIVVVVEAEFDAMLVAQEAGDLCCCIALGGAQKRPDESLHQWLLKKQLIIFALDFDKAGKKECGYWCAKYENIHLWPVPIGKSPGDALEQGLNLKSWIYSGIKNWDEMRKR